MDEDQLRPDDAPGTASSEPRSGGGAPPSGAVATATPPPPPEKPRRRLRTAVIAAVVVVALAAVAIAGWMYLDLVSARNAAVDRLDEATRLVERADPVVLDLDEIVRGDIDAEVGERAQEVAGQVPEAAEDLNRAIQLIGEAQEDLPAEDVAYAIALRDSAAARLEMLDTAEPIIEAIVKASAALAPSTEGWELVLEAEELSTEAAEEYSKLNREGVNRSTELADEAIAKIERAREHFSEAATGFPEVDFEAYDEYCEKKTAAMEISKDADAAWLAGDIARANTLGTRYNEAEQELAELASELTSPPSVLIATAFEDLTGGPTELYFEARARAAAADARLRQTTGQPEPEPEDTGAEEPTSPPEPESDSSEEESEE